MPLAAGRCFSTSFLYGVTLPATPCVGTSMEGTTVPDKASAGGAQVSWSGRANILECFWGELHEQQGCPCRDLWLPAQALSPIPSEVLMCSFVSMGFWSMFLGGQGAGHIEEPLSSEGGTWPESLCSHKMSFPEPEEPWWISDNAHQPSCAVSTPSPTLHPLAQGKVPSGLGWQPCFLCSFHQLKFFVLFLNVLRSLEKFKVC